MPEDKIEQNSETKETPKAKSNESPQLGKTYTFDIDFNISDTHHESEPKVTVPDFRKADSESKK